MKVKVFVLYGRNDLLDCISASVYATKDEAESYAKTYYDRYRIDEHIIEPIEIIEESK